MGEVRERRTKGGRELSVMWEPSSEATAPHEIVDTRIGCFSIASSLRRPSEYNVTNALLALYTAEPGNTYMRTTSAQGEEREGGRELALRSASEEMLKM